MDPNLLRQLQQIYIVALESLDLARGHDGLPASVDRIDHDPRLEDRRLTVRPRRGQADDDPRRGPQSLFDPTQLEPDRFDLEAYMRPELLDVDQQRQVSPLRRMPKGTRRECRSSESREP
jgi:hypothetical protein